MVIQHLTNLSESVVLNTSVLIRFFLYLESVAFAQSKVTN